MINPATAMWINVVLTGLGGGFTAVQAMNGGSNAWAGAAVTLITALNTIFHGISSPQAGPIVK